MLTLTAPPAAAAPLNPLGCREWFDDAQRALKEHRIHDAGSRRIEWYPHLRATRWLAAIRPAPGNRDAGRFWLRQLAGEAEAGWHAELTRLPRHSRLEPASTAARVERMRACIEILLNTTNAARVPPVNIPDAYSGWRRALGIYPVSRWLARPSIHGYREEMRERFDRETEFDRFHYLPPGFHGTLPRPDALAHNPLDMPWPTEGATAALLAHYAPVLSVADRQPHNQPGSVGLSGGIPVSAPLGATAYGWVSWQWFRDRPALQLNYQFWFSRRPAQGLIDPYAGRLDGLIWRVTLRPDGRVLTYDSIHPCGCYHKVYPVDPALRPVAPEQAGQPVFWPWTAPDALRQRIQVVLEPDTHYVVAVRAFDGNSRGEVAGRYRLADADQLRRLPTGDGYGSFFGADGLVAGSQRPERFFLWPLGVPSAGAMRQPGHHAIAFIGERHFDAPRMLESVLRTVRDF